MVNVYKLTRDLTLEECPWLVEVKLAGSVVYQYEGYTYGVVSSNGIAVYEKENCRDIESGEIVQRDSPFFEVPKDAIRFIYTM